MGVPVVSGWTWPRPAEVCSLRSAKGQGGGHTGLAWYVHLRARPRRPSAGWALFPLGLGLSAPGCAQWEPTALLALSSQQQPAPTWKPGP